MGNVTMFSDVRCPLVRCTYPNDALVDRIHKFKLCNVPVVNQTIFALLTARIVDSGFAGMEFLKGNLEKQEMLIVE